MFDNSNTNHSSLFINECLMSSFLSPVLVTYKPTMCLCHRKFRRDLKNHENRDDVIRYKGLNEERQSFGSLVHQVL